MKSISDNELIRNTIEGDKECFAELFRRYAIKIRSIINNRISDKDEAKDVFQQVQIRIWEKITEDRYTENGKFVSWACTIARNACMDYFRQQQKKNAQTVSLENNQYFDFDTYANKVSEMQSEVPIEIDLSTYINLLPTKQREVIILRFYQNMTFKQIALNTHVNINTVQGQYRYALEKLYKMLHNNPILFGN